jgi:short-subunit dehydrogenase
MDLQHEYPGIHVSLVMPGMVDTEFASNALGTTSVPPRGGPMKPQTAAEVADAMIKLIESPVPEIYTNPASPDIVRRYYADIAAFEANYQ